MAREIAEVLGARNKMKGYIEGNGISGYLDIFGHLCTLKEPHEYTPEWKRWSLSSLPMIPPRFGIAYRFSSYVEQFQVNRETDANAEMVINCGDAGQEGELIQRWVMQKSRCYLSGLPFVDLITY